MLLPLCDVPEIHRRLLQVFPEGTPQRTYCTREMAARAVFVMLYIGAVEGSGTWMTPKHVYRMGVAQSLRARRCRPPCLYCRGRKARLADAGRSLVSRQHARTDSG